MIDKVENEILQLISTTWLDSPNEDLNSSYVIRYWSIDTQWMDYSQAEKLIDNLVKNNWLISIEGFLRINIPVVSESIKFGWAPDLRILEMLPQNKDNNSEILVENKIAEKSPLKEDLQIQLNSTQRRLVRYISANTGILKDEVIRRCARKKRSLGQITTTFCLLLIAKEQGMDMSELIKGIGI